MATIKTRPLVIGVAICVGVAVSVGVTVGVRVAVSVGIIVDVGVYVGALIIGLLTKSGIRQRRFLPEVRNAKQARGTN